MAERRVRMNRVEAAAWIAAAALSFLYLSADWLAAWRSGSLSVAPGTILGRDFVNVFTGGHLVLADALALTYDLDRYSAYQTALTHGLVSNHAYSYPPVSFLYAWMFALVPYAVGYALWTLLTGAAFALAARPYLAREGLSPWLALLLPAAMINVWAGHYGFLIGALWLGAWRWIDERPRLAGCLVGLMIVKPHLAILMPILLLRRRAWTAIASATVTMLALAAVSALAFGLDPWRAYVGHTLGQHAGVVDDVHVFMVSMMPTVAPALFRLSAAPALAWTVQLLVAGFAIAALWWRLPRDPLRAGLAGACGTFLVLPYAFTYDMTVVSVAALILLHRDDGRSLPATVCVLLGFLLPLVTVFLSRANLPLAPFVLAGLLAMLLARKQPASAAAAPAETDVQPA